MFYKYLLILHIFYNEIVWIRYSIFSSRQLNDIKYIITWNNWVEFIGAGFWANKSDVSRNTLWMKKNSLLSRMNEKALYYRLYDFHEIKMDGIARTHEGNFFFLLFF